MISLSGPLLAKFDPSSPIALDLNSVLQKLARKDPSLWGDAAQAEASIRLDWIDLPNSSQSLTETIAELRAWFKENGLKQIVLCGMGGSSLAPEVFGNTYGKDITILDSTDPEQIIQVTPKTLTQTLFIIGSKSGSTIETASQKLYFEQKLRDENLEPTKHILIITDPNSPLNQSARRDGYRVVNANPNVGGRFSALSAFGLIPAALLGIDIETGLRDSSILSKELIKENSVAVICATLLIEQAKQCIAFADQGSNVSGLSDWIEQLIAESTGKDGKGRIPVVLENSGADISGDIPLVTFTEGVGDLSVIGTLFEHFIFWEWVTALMGRALGVDPFNQPNVTEAKERTGKLLENWPPNLEKPSFENDDLQIFSKSQYQSIEGALVDFLAPASAYIAIMAYLNRESDGTALQLREILAAKTGSPITFGWGPRFLHSTGQFHKGGPLNGKFIQITGENSSDLNIPTRTFTFHDLLMAQALGDGQALSSRDLPLVRIHLKNRSAGLAQLIQALRKI